ncbi:MAG: hypothetical protein IPI49_18540 [Myxococcales bacterium]|nr:hypothetical protein [Myxococcales bacterium]
MSNGAPTPVSPSSDSRAYKRSWKNLLINKQVQLRFTLFMVGLSAVLMTLLGIWVKRVADNTTEVGLARVRGELCPPMPQNDELGNEPEGALPATPVESDLAPSAPTSGSADGADGAAGAVDGSGAEPGPQPGLDPSVPSEVADPSAPPAASTAEPERRARVQIDESSMTMTPAAPKDVRARVQAHKECEVRQAGLIKDLEDRRRNIVWILFATGIFLCGGLAFYGIKMTHRVAGPLHKISLYFAKMREGRYGPVYPLRKGDELMEFYEHFKAAHAGVRKAETADVTRMRAVVEASGRGPHDPELTKVLTELQAAIERKEKSLE